MNVDRYISLFARLVEDNEAALVAARADRSEFSVLHAPLLFFPG